jgi:hypothetical protein
MIGTLDEWLLFEEVEEMGRMGLIVVVEPSARMLL